MSVNLKYQFQVPPETQDPKAKAWMADVASKLNKMVGDINRGTSTEVTGIVINIGGSSGGGGGGSTTTADNVRTGSQSVTTAGATISFATAFPATYSIVIVFAWMILSDGSLAFPTIDPTTVTLSGFTVSGIYETTTVYYHALAR